MIEQVARTAATLLRPRSRVIVGHQASGRNSVPGQPGRDGFALQDPQLGTAHALQQAEPLLAGRTGTSCCCRATCPCSGRPRWDACSKPIGREGRSHGGYRHGRTPLRLRPHRPDRRRIARIVEERDASPAQRQIREINSGIYAFDLAPLFDALRDIAAERPGRVLPDRPGCHLSPAQAAGGNPHRRRPRRNPRHQQPHRTGRSGRQS